MNNCQFIEDDGKFKCINGGYITPFAGLKKNCIKQNPPNLLKRGVNLGKAMVKHAKTGMHHCTFEEKQSRFETCKSNECGLFKVHGEGGICSHDDCGCYIRSNGKFMDKLSWAESKCPVGKWGPIEQKTQESPENGV